MPKYNEATVVGETWRRSPGLTGTNVFGTNPILSYDEEDLLLLEDNSVMRRPVVGPSNRLFVELSAENALTQFQLRNPQTEEYIEAYATYQDLFVLVHSLYFHLAKIRDRGPSPYPSWTYNETTQQWEAPTPSPEGNYWVWNETNQEWEDSRPPSPYPSWVWGLDAWEAPVPKPETGEWAWDEPTTSWVAV